MYYSFKLLLVVEFNYCCFNCYFPEVDYDDEEEAAEFYSAS